MESNWKFIDVKQLILRTNNEKVDDSFPEEEEKVVSETVLSGIKQAILDGNKLRENPFVKQSEVSGYRFTAMTYLFQHKTRPCTVQISAEFKGRPKVFEVSIKDSSLKRLSPNGVLSTLEVDKEEFKIKNFMWDMAKEIYYNIKTNKLLEVMV